MPLLGLRPGLHWKEARALTTELTRQIMLYFAPKFLWNSCFKPSCMKKKCKNVIYIYTWSFSFTSSFSSSVNVKSICSTNFVIQTKPTNHPPTNQLTNQPQHYGDTNILQTTNNKLYRFHLKQYKIYGFKYTYMLEKNVDCSSTNVCTVRSTE